MLLGTAFLLALSPVFTAYPSGIADQNVANAGCSCHSGTANSGVSALLDGVPETYDVGETYSLNISISGGPSIGSSMINQGGFVLVVSDGSLSPIDNSTGKNATYNGGGVGGEKYTGSDILTHSAEGNDQRAWPIEWTAPDIPGKDIEFQLVVNSVDGDGMNGVGDQWNTASYYIGAPTASALSVILTGTLLAIIISVAMLAYVFHRASPDAFRFEVFWPWLKGWLTTTDHKGVGTLYFWFGFLFFLVGGIFALLFRIQLAQPESDFLTQQQYNQFFTLHGTTMIFLAAMPLISALANYIVPLQIGAKDLAFPRLNAFAFWLLPASTILIFWGVFSNGAADTGWTGYAPYSTTTTTPGTTMWVAGQLMLGASSTLSGVNFIATIFTMRAPGVTWMKMPLFTWSILVSVFMLFISLPAFVIGLVFIFLDRTIGTAFYDIAAGGDPLLWAHLFWYFGHPEVYVVILPAFGVISEVLATGSHRSIFGYKSMVWAMAGIGVLGFVVWGHHMLTAGTDPQFRFITMLLTMLVAVPTGVKIFNWLATLHGGAIMFHTHMLWALGFLVTFTIGGISGMYFASIPLDLHLHETYFVVAHFHYVFIGGTVFGILSAIYYWYPKVTGRCLNETWGRIHFIIAFTSYNIAFWPMHQLGLDGMLRRTHSYAESTGYGGANMLITVSSFIFGISMIILLVNIIISTRKGVLAGNNPWGGWSLEWTTTSPPPTPSFGDDVRQENAPTNHISKPSRTQRFISRLWGLQEEQMPSKEEMD